IAQDSVAYQRARVAIGMPKPAGEKRVGWIEVQIQAGCGSLFPGPVRKTRRRHRLIGRLIFSETHIAIDPQQRSASWFGIGNQVWTDGVKPRLKVGNKAQGWVTHEFFVAPLVRLKPFAVVVLAEIAEKLEKLRREIVTLLHRCSPAG